MYESGLSSWFKSTIRQTSRPPDMTRTMSGLPSPLVSSFCAELDVMSQSSCSISVGRPPLVGVFGPASFDPPQAAATKLTSKTREGAIIGLWRRIIVLGADLGAGTSPL